MKLLHVVVILLLSYSFSEGSSPFCTLTCEGRCISQRSLCNGRQDCPQGEDEQNCTTFQCANGFEKCADDLQCIRISDKCDGRKVHCADGSDEDDEYCRTYECKDPFRKCRNNIQCVYKGNFCSKSRRGNVQYDCKDMSDETVWGCAKVGKNCSKSNELWACQGNNDTSLCIEESKVCDGYSGTLSNNCENEEDERAELCRDWNCPVNHVKCSDGVQCLHVANICNGIQNCHDASDEVAIKLENDIMDNCSLPGSPCISIATEHWLDVGHKGFRCDNRHCLDATRVCDGICDCKEGCIDEDMKMCKYWECSSGLVKCASTHICLPAAKICDGRFDCGLDDSSDESECPCDSRETTSTYLRSLLVPILSMKCGNQSNMDMECLQKMNVNLSIQFDSKLIGIDLNDTCGLEPCLLSKVTLNPGENPLLDFSRSREKQQKVFSRYEAKISLPLTELSFNYTLFDDNIGANESSIHCLTRMLLSNDIVHRILASIQMRNTTINLCQCYDSFNRIEFMNEYLMPSAFYQDMRSYYVENIANKFGQFELLYTFEDDCLEGTSLWHIQMNDIYPTISYGSGKVKDSKNIPMKIFSFSKERNCRSYSEDSLRLLTLLEFSSYIESNDKENALNNISAENRNLIESCLCSNHTKTFEYVNSPSSITYLILTRESITLNEVFTIRNERNGLYETHQLLDVVYPKSIRVVVRSLSNKGEVLELGNKELFRELFIKSDEINLDADHAFLRLHLPRKQKDYIQLDGLKSLKDCLNEAGIEYDGLKLFKVCQNEREKDCFVEKLSRPDHISQALSARWSSSCFQIQFDTGDSFMILPSKEDTFYVMFNKTRETLVAHPDSLTSSLKLTVKSLSSQTVQKRLDTSLVKLDGQMLCPSQSSLQSNKYFFPTLASSLLHNNTDCITELCFQSGLFIQRENFHFIGPFSAIWQSDCLEEFGVDLIADIMEAKERGILTLNKFWAFDHYNYMVFSNFADVKQVESAYLTVSIFIFELTLGIVMCLICLFTVLGNLLVFLGLLLDPNSKKSVYQYLQMSLCLADVLMGIAGSGGIAYLQFSLLFGSWNIYNFIVTDAFTSAFENPQVASSSGLNQFYFITSEPALVIFGTLVSQSTTVSLILLCAMAFTRHQIATSATSQRKIFRWAVKHKLCAALLPWFVGLLFTLLHLIDFEHLKFTCQAFFDPVSKLTILLPASSNPLNFYIQAAVAASFTILTITFSIGAWRAINKNAKDIQAKGMISQENILQKRVLEERKWLRLTVAIVLAFMISVLPVSVFYVLSIMRVDMESWIQMVVWWLLVCGSFFNLIIYGVMNENMRESIWNGWRFILFKIRVAKDGSGLSETAESRTKSVTLAHHSSKTRAKHV